MGCLCFDPYSKEMINWVVFQKVFGAGLGRVDGSFVRKVVR